MPSLVSDPNANVTRKSPWSNAAVRWMAAALSRKTGLTNHGREEVGGGGRRWEKVREGWRRVDIWVEIWGDHAPGLTNQGRR